MRVSWCGPTSESFPLKSADFSAFIIELHYNDTESRMTTSHTIRQRRKDSDEREKLLLNGSERSTVVVKTLAEIQGRLSIFQSSYEVKTFSAWNPLSIATCWENYDYTSSSTIFKSHTKKSSAYHKGRDKEVFRTFGSALGRFESSDSEKNLITLTHCRISCWL